MKKLTIMFAFMAMLMGFGGCKKESIQNAKNIALAEKFYAVTDKTKPVVKRVIEQIKQSGRYADLEAYVTKYGYPNWDKAITKPKKTFSIENVSGGENDGLFIPTVFLNSNKVDGFIAVSIVGGVINFASYLDTDYKKFPYESSNASGITAENVVGILLALENTTFGYEKFGVNDPQLSFYRTQQLNSNGEIPLLQINAHIDPLVGETCYWECWVWDDGRGHITQLTNWVALFCWGGSDPTVPMTSAEPGGSGGGGGGSAPPPPINNDFEICKKNFDDFIASGQACSEPESETTLSETNEVKSKQYEWRIFKNLTWALFSKEIGIHQRDPNPPNSSLQWKWKSLTHQSLRSAGLSLGGSITYQDKGCQVDMGIYNAGVTVDYELHFSAVCSGSPLSWDLSYSSPSPAWSSN
jgi:hypothetical protein